MDMQLKNYLQNRFPFFVALSLTFVLVSCSSYQYVGYDNDGIYNDDIPEEDVVYIDNNTSNNSDYYKNYFSEKAQEYEEIIAENEIFTDIDSYEGSYEDTEQDSIQTNESEDYRVGYAGWGQENTDVTINIYNDNFGYNYWWYRPYRYGWNWYNPYRWSIGWSYWDYPYAYNSWWAPHYYGGYYHNPYYYGYGYSSIYSRRHVAYNAGRRGTPYLNGSNTRVATKNRATNSPVRRSFQTTRSSSRSIINSSTIRRTRSDSQIRRSSNSSSRSNRSSTIRPRRVNKSSTPKVKSRTESRNNSSIRSSSPSVRSSGTSRSSSSRSSGRSSSRRGY